MALFNFGKKKEEKNTCSCKCGCSSSACGEQTCTNEAEKNVNNGTCTIKVLGSGCKNCHTLHENVKEAVKNMGIEADVQYVTDMSKIMTYGVMSMPALVVNEKVVSMGKVLKAADVQNILSQLGF